MNDQKAQSTTEPAEPTGTKRGSISLTPTAVEWVKRARSKEGKEGAALRLGVKAGGCSGFSYFMGFTTARRAGDLVLEYDGLTVYVDPKSLEYLDGTVVDYERGMLNTGIKFKNPRVKKACGCGDSFSF